MKPPIIVADGEDVSIFDSSQAAESYHEWIDVEGGELRAWDSRGARLSMEVVDEVRKHRLLGTKREKRVIVTEVSPTEDGSRDLRALLTRRLMSHGEGETTLSQLELSQLVHLAAEYYLVKSD